MEATLSNDWADFLGLNNPRPVKLSVGSPVKTVQKTIDWVEKQVAPALAIIRETVGIDTLMAIIESGFDRLGKKHVQIIRQWINGEWDKELIKEARELGGVIVADNNETTTVYEFNGFTSVPVEVSVEELKKEGIFASERLTFWDNWHKKRYEWQQAQKRKKTSELEWKQKHEQAVKELQEYEANRIKADWLPLLSGQC